MLGQLGTASKLYSSAKDLIEGAMLTSADYDPERQRRLRVYSEVIEEKIRLCRQKEAEAP